MYTGNTLNGYKKSPEWAVYPCVYREHPRDRYGSIAPPGLSLCIQGTPLNNGINYRYAQVYPCVYREHGRFYFSNYCFGGLSLCIQGTPDLRDTKLARTRFTPVYTGNT